MNMNSKRKPTYLFLALLFVLALVGVGEAAQPPYRDASRPIAQRVEDLLGQNWSSGVGARPV
jgi:hypothetical protein